MLFSIDRIIAKLKTSPDYYKPFSIQRLSGEGFEIKTEYYDLHSEKLKEILEKIALKNERKNIDGSQTR